MAEADRFKRWFLQEQDLAGLDPVKARDLIIKCFYEAQKETFARSKQELGLSTNDEQLHASVQTAIKLVFKEIGEDFEKPTKATLMKVVDVLGRRASAWGTPQDIIEHHKGQIQKVLTILK